jgi:hypothetical protein
MSQVEKPTDAIQPISGPVREQSAVVVCVRAQHTSDFRCLIRSLKTNVWASRNLRWMARALSDELRSDYLPTGDDSDGAA